jgi:hypothetical protein
MRRAGIASGVNNAVACIASLAAVAVLTWPEASPMPRGLLPSGTVLARAVDLRGSRRGRRGVRIRDSRTQSRALTAP